MKNDQIKKCPDCDYISPTETVPCKKHQVAFVETDTDIDKLVEDAVHRTRLLVKRNFNTQEIIVLKTIIADAMRKAVEKKDRLLAEYTERREPVIHALDAVWGLMYPGKTDWKYAGQVVVHIRQCLKEKSDENI